MKKRTLLLLAILMAVLSITLSAPRAFAGHGGSGPGRCEGANTYFGYYRNSGSDPASMPYSYTLDYSNTDEHGNPKFIANTMNFETKLGQISPEDHTSFIKWKPTVTQKQIFGEGQWTQDKPYRYAGGELKYPRRTRSYQIDTKNWRRYISIVSVCFFDTNYPAPPSTSGGVG